MVDRRRQGLCGMSVQWPAVSGVGMAAATILRDGASEGVMGGSINPAHVEDVLTRVLTDTGVDVYCDMLVLPSMSLGDLGVSRIGRQYSGLLSQQTTPQRNISRGKAKYSSQQGMRRDDLSPNKVKNIIARVISSQLGTSDVEDNAALMDVGLDSLGAAELAGALSKEFGIRMLPTAIFSYPTIADLTTHALDLLGWEESTSYGGEPLGSISIKSDLMDLGKDSDRHIAIVGVSCLLPGGIDSMDGLWDTLCNKRDMTGEASL
eukprot:gene28508-50372_t